MMMWQLIAHLVGDYVLQNHWMAAEKTSRTWPALVHVFFYSIPFTVLIALTPDLSWYALPIITLTHFIIDRWRLARHWINFWGVGKPGYLFPRLFKTTGSDAPPFLSVWLLIIVDNTLHLTINAMALGLLK